MGRTGWLAVVALGAIALGAAVRWARPSPRPALPCDPESVRWVDAGTVRIARCAPELPRTAVPASQALAVGQKLDLNAASEADLVALPGVGPSLAHALVRSRPFATWDDVDRIPGVGPAKLEVLKEHARLGPPGR